MAIFKLIDTFNLTNRGCVLIGDITIGTISAGDYIVLPNNTEILKLRILAIEIADVNIKGNIAHVGLLISTEDNEKIKDIIIKGLEINISTFQ